MFVIVKLLRNVLSYYVVGFLMEKMCVREREREREKERKREREKKRERLLERRIERINKQ